VACSAAAQLSLAKSDAAEARAALERLQAEKGSSEAVAKLTVQLRGSRDAAKAAVKARREAESRVEALEAQLGKAVRGGQGEEEEGGKRRPGPVVTVCVEAC
jgi:hypothetical protein